MTAPTEATAEVRRAEALIGVGRFDDAIATLGKVLVAAPENVKAHCLMAQCYGALDQPGRMLNAADRAIACAPQSEWAHRLRSTALRGLNQPRAALDAARQAIALAPHVWATHVTLVEVLLQSEQREARRDAYEAAKRAVALAPHIPATHNTIGRVLLSIGEHRLAQRHFEKAIALDPTNSAAHTNLAIADLRKGRLGAAAERFSEVVANNPSVASYVGNVKVAADTWLQRVLDIGWLLCSVELALAAGLGAAFRYGAIIAVGVVPIGLGAVALMYLRLRRPMRALIRQRLRDGRVIQRVVLLAAILTLLSFAVVSAGMSSDHPAPLIGSMLIWWLIAFIVRFHAGINVRLRWVARRRRYSRFVLGADRKLLASGDIASSRLAGPVPAQRQSGD